MYLEERKKGKEILDISPSEILPIDSAEVATRQNKEQTVESDVLMNLEKVCALGTLIFPEPNAVLRQLYYFIFKNQLFRIYKNTS